jgi:Type IX secretion system protein PorV
VPDINLAYLSGYKKVGNGQALAASFRYFSLGNIVFTDITGVETGQFKPAEFAFDVAYSRKLSDNFSGGIALRYIYSNLTGGQYTGGENYRPGQSVAADISTLYRKADLSMGDKKTAINIGLNISNLGAKMAYNRTGKKDFLPANIRLGTAWEIHLDQYNKLTIAVDLNKLMVPTAGYYITDTKTKATTFYGKPSDVPLAKGIFQSFSDAPGGGKEELKEINYATGLEYWYDNVFAVRTGYFFESKYKGNRKFLTLGFGLKYNVFHLDGAYLIPASRQNSPLSNTFRFTLAFDFDNAKKKKAVTD